MDKERLVEPPELALSSHLIDELRVLINGPKYDRLKVSELCGCLELLKLEYALKWKQED